MRKRDKIISRGKGQLKEKINRLVLEHCCGDDSLMGKPCADARGSRVVRLTQREDMTTECGLNFAKTKIDETPPPR